MRNWLRTFLFISAFSPALLTMAYVRYDIYGWRTDVVQLIAIGLLGYFFPFSVIKLIRTQGESFPIQVKKIESNDFMLFAFISSYLFPLIAKGADISINAIALILVIAGFVLWLISSLPAHPLLRVLRFRFYKLESSTGMVYTLISKRDIRDRSTSCPRWSTSSTRTASASASCWKSPRILKAYRSAPACPMMRWRASPRSATVSRAWKSRPVCSASIRLGRWRHM